MARYIATTTVREPTFSTSFSHRASTPASIISGVTSTDIRLLKAAGARFLIGTDGPGPIYDEVEHLAAIRALSPLETLSVALNTGRHLYPTRRVGCFEPGCEADFLVLSAVPSRD